MHNIESRPQSMPRFPLQPQAQSEPKVPSQLPSKVPVSGPSPSERDKASSLLANAIRLVEAKELELAKALVAEVLRIRPNSPEALRTLVRCLDPLRENKQRIKVFEAILSVDNSFESLKSLADAYYVQGQDTEALPLYEQAISIPGVSELAHFEILKNMGNILVREQDYEGAEDCYNRAHCVDPHSDVLMVNLGTLAIQRNDYPLALEKFRRALEISGKNDKAFVGLALVYAELGDQAQAQINIEKAIQANPLNRTAIQIYSQAALREQKTDQNASPMISKAIDALANFLSQESFDSEMSLLLVHLLCTAQRFREARIEVERLLLWQPDHQDALALENALNSVDA
jgi:tetratricopeptide (TPR) repeat protein